MKKLILLLFIVKSIFKIGCQVKLTRQLFDEWFCDDLSKLEVIDVSSRDIESIDRETFNGLTQIMVIHLSNLSRSQNFQWITTFTMVVIRKQSTNNARKRHISRTNTSTITSVIR